MAQSFIGSGERSTAENCVPRRLWLRWPGGVVRTGILLPL